MLAFLIILIIALIATSTVFIRSRIITTKEFFEQEQKKKAEEELKNREAELARQKAEEEKRKKYEEELARQRAAELKRKEEEEIERKKREEYLKKFKCNLCLKPSMGKFFCSECQTRTDLIKKEIPPKKVSTYQSTHYYQIDLMRKIVYPNSGFEKDYSIMLLYNTNLIMHTKYNDTQDIAIKFIKDYNAGIDSNELAQKYSITAPKRTTTYTEDFRAKYDNRDYRCTDGDYVRSKAEREIDNFFFQNRIFHIYENEYKHPHTGKTYSPDFYLPDYNLYIEYFGGTDSEYIKSRNEKIDAYESDESINFEYLTYKDDYIMEQKLREICRKYNILLKY